jgi:hypothetical protein
MVTPSLGKVKKISAPVDPGVIAVAPDSRKPV